MASRQVHQLRYVILADTRFGILNQTPVVPDEFPGGPGGAGYGDVHHCHVQSPQRTSWGIVALAMKIRTHLVLLGLVILIPMVAFAVVAVVALDRQQRAAVERGAVETSRALSPALDRELSGMLATLSTLATARSLERNDLTAFYEDARRVHASRPEWNTILLIAPTGQLVMDTYFPFGLALPRIVERESFETVLRTGAPSVGPVQFGPISQQYASAIRVPIRRNGRIVYVLTGVIEVGAIQRLLSTQQIPEAWIGTVFDSKQTMVARTHGAEQFVGRACRPSS